MELVLQLAQRRNSIRVVNIHMEINTISQDLYDKLVGRFPGVKLGDADAQVTTQPQEARFYTFEYAEAGAAPLGTVTVSLADDTTLKIIYSRAITEGLAETDQWFKFLRGMRRFATRHMLEFEVNDITKPELSQQDLEQEVTEGVMYGSRKTSYQKLPSVRLIVRHTSSVDETVRGARSRRISKIFAETAQGERFLLPTVKLSMARALAQHISNGGRPWDELAEQILTVAAEPEYKALVQRASTQRGYARLKAAIEEDKNMDLKLTEDRADDLLVAAGNYEDTRSLVAAVMEMIARRTESDTVRVFAENYTKNMPRAVELVRAWVESVRNFKEDALVTEQDDRTVSALRQLAMDMGELDRSDINMVADMIADGSDPELIRQYILDLDTAPREAILDTIDSFEPGMIKALFPKDHNEKYFAVMREDKAVGVKLSNIDWVAEPGMDIPSSMTISVDIPHDADEDDVYDIIVSTLEDEVGYSVRDFDFQLEEGYTVLPNYDSERYGNREQEGLEGPMRARNGKVVYYDKAEGLYYDPDRDMFISHDEWDEMNRDHVPGGDMYAAPKKFSHKSQTFKEAVTTAVAWPAQEYFDMSNEERDEIGDCFAPHRNKISSSFEKRNGQLMLVVDGDAKAMAACQKAMKQKGIKFMATEGADLSEATTTIDPNKLYSGTFIYVYDDEYMVVSTNKDKTIVYAYDANSGETVPIKVSDITDMEEVGDDEIQDYPKEARVNEDDVEESIQYMYSLKDKGMSVEEIAKELNMTPEEVRDAMSKTESVEVRKPVRYDSKQSMPSIMKYAYQPDVTRALRKAAGLSDDAPVYFDDADLVYGDETVIPRCLVDDNCTFGDAVKALKKMRESVEENVSAPQTAAHRRAQLPKKVKLKGFGKNSSNMSNPNARAALKPGMDEDMMPSDARKIADEEGVEVYVHSGDDEGSAIDVHKNGEKVASGYYDMFAGDFVVDGKSFRELRDVVSYYGIPDLTESLNDIMKLAGLKK